MNSQQRRKQKRLADRLELVIDQRIRELKADYPAIEIPGLDSNRDHIAMHDANVVSDVRRKVSRIMFRVRAWFYVRLLIFRGKRAARVAGSV